MNNVRPASYAPATGADGQLMYVQHPQSNLNNFDTVRSYGSAADELELYVPPPPDFLQNLNNQQQQGMPPLANGPVVPMGHHHYGPAASPRRVVMMESAGGAEAAGEHVQHPAAAMMAAGVPAMVVRRAPQQQHAGQHLQGGGRPSWIVNDLDSIKGSYYDSQKIQNGEKSSFLIYHNFFFLFFF